MELRKEILEGTLTVFNQKGLKFTMDDVAKTDQVKCFLSVELSMGQMIEDIRLSTDCRRPVYLCNRTGGMIPSPDQVLQSIYDAQKGAM